MFVRTNIPRLIKSIQLEYIEKNMIPYKVLRIMSQLPSSTDIIITIIIVVNMMSGELDQIS